MHIKGNLLKVYGVTVTVFSLGFFFTASAFAFVPSGILTTPMPPRDEFSPRPSFSPDASFNPRPTLTPRASWSPRPSGSTEGNTNACLSRESDIKRRSGNLVQLAGGMEEKFGSIQKRVEDYYASKLVPNGKTVSNYSALIADIQAKKALVDAALTKSKTDIAGFSCTTDSPKTVLMQFNSDMRAVKSALQDYRTSIKNLIVAVRSVAGDDGSPNPGFSPNPSASPVTERGRGNGVGRNRN